MTIKKISLSAIAASMVATSAFAAGVLTTKPETMALELVKDQNVSVKSDINATYKPSMNAGVTDGKFVINLNGATINDNNLSNTYIYNKKQGKIVTKAGTQTTGNGGAKILLDINDSINSGDTLYLVTGTTGTSPSTDLNLTVLSNAKSASMTMQIVNNNDTTLDTSNSKDIMTISPEWSASIKKSFDGLIDASNSFGQFINNTAPDTTTKDTATISITKATLTHNANISNLYFYVKPDNNVSTMGTFSLNDGTTTTNEDASYEYNTTVSTISVSRDINASFTDINKTEIKETNFTVSAKISGVVDNSSYKGDLLTATSFGAWSIYGYKADIPNVRGDGIFETTLKFTNRSSINTKVYFTLIDQAGTVVSFDSSKVASVDAQSLSANKTVTYKASELRTLAHNKDANFANAGTFSVEVSIPTTPNKVYGYASFKNKDLGQFKDLPIYNSSKMTY